jgi:transposase InsO family protein
MSDDKNERSSHQVWAEFRFMVIGHLLSGVSSAENLKAEIKALSEMSWWHPITKEPKKYSYSTIERWYYTAKNKDKDPVGSLRRKLRSDCGNTRQMSLAIKSWLQNSHGNYPNWSYRLHFDNLVTHLNSHPEDGMSPSYASVVRYMQKMGYRKLPRPRSPLSPGQKAALYRRQSVEIRSYENEYVGGLWHLDFHHCSRQILTSAGEYLTPLCLGILDDRSRLCCHIQWYWNEDTKSLVHGFTQALQKRGLPRALLTDNGSAMMGAEFGEGLGRLGIIHDTTLPYSAYQNGKQESFWGQLEGRLVSMLQNQKQLSLTDLNIATQAWAEMEYNRKVHSEIQTTPLERFLSDKDVLRESPDLGTLKLAFRMDSKRTQRRSDGTFVLQGVRFEIPYTYRTLLRLTVRYARWDLSQVHLIDDRTQNMLCQVHPLDRTKNADGRRRKIDTVIARDADKAGADEQPPLMQKLLTEYSALGLPPAYLPLNEEGV